MKKTGKMKVGIGAVVMIAAMVVSDRAEIFVIYALSAVLHELGHLAAAKLMRIGIEEIRFDFSGVRIVTDGQLTSYKKEIILAAAGPLVNFLITASTFSALKLNGISVSEAFLGIESFIGGGGVTVWGAVGFFALSSILQGGINLLPVKTFDGGRILYCSIAQLCGERAASRVLSVSSAVAAFILWTISLYMMLRISAGLGIYVFALCIFGSTLNETELS